ncbi:hypothetical protein PilKf_02290 [Pillotina sp. SPG140]|jgi:hypothetical protein
MYINNEIDALHTYLRDLRNHVQSKDLNGAFHAEQTGDFCTSLSECIYEALDKGFCHLDAKTIKCTSPCTKEYFITGFTLLQNGIDNNTVIVSLEFLSAYILKTTEHITANEILEIKILEKVLPMIQRLEIKDYLFTISNFCSGHSTAKILKMYQKYIDR